MKLGLLIVVATAGLLGADLNGKCNFIWQTPGGERRSTLTFTQNAEQVEGRFPEGKDPVTGTFKDGRLSLPGACTRPRQRTLPTFSWMELCPRVT
jgi:hypothetical protein